MHGRLRQLAGTLFIAGKSLTRGPFYGPSAARADGRRTKFHWREVRTVNSWSHLMQQHAAHGVRAESSHLPTRPGLWPPAPEVKPKATSGVLSSYNMYVDTTSRQSLVIRFKASDKADAGTRSCDNYVQWLSRKFYDKEIPSSNGKPCRSHCEQGTLASLLEGLGS